MQVVQEEQRVSAVRRDIIDPTTAAIVAPQVAVIVLLLQSALLVMADITKAVTLVYINAKVTELLLLANVV